MWNGSIKPIETIYQGHKFRCRLEARWAVFFDELEILWEYEKEGYDLGDGIYYLPDFYLPEQEYWIEIKGVRPTDKESNNFERFIKGIKQDGFIFFGQVPGKDDSALAYLAEGVRDNFHQWCECPCCGYLGTQHEGRAERLDCDCDIEETHTGGALRIVHAYDVAKQKRFEHKNNERWI